MMALKRKILLYERLLKEKTRENTYAKLKNKLVVVFEFELEYSKASETRKLTEKLENECQRLRVHLAQSVPETEFLKEKDQYLTIINRLIDENMHLRQVVGKFEHKRKESEKLLTELGGGEALVRQFRTMSINTRKDISSQLNLKNPKRRASSLENSKASKSVNSVQRNLKNEGNESLGILLDCEGHPSINNTNFNEKSPSTQPTPQSNRSLITCVRRTQRSTSESSKIGAIRNLRSHYDAATDTILVDWEWDELSGELGRQLLEDYEIFVRYKVSRQGQNEDEWRRVEAEEDGLGARIPLGRLSLSDGDEIRVDKTNFLLGHLVPGERYEITLRSATSSDRISSAAAIVEIALPKEDEGALMDVGNLLVTSRFMHDGRGVVNLTWEVPPQLIGKIKSYEMRYIEASNAQSGIERWEHLHFPGEAPHAQLYSMKPDTEYLIRIRTLLISGLQVESGEFRIHTPRIKEPNPLARLDVLYSSEQPTVRLQWTHIHSSEITGYDLRITDRYDLPESEWRHHRVSGYSPQFALDNLRPYTTYFVRVDIRKNNGDVLKGNTIYRFTTLANLPVIPNENFVDKGNEVQPLAFEQIDRGRVKIIWEFPSTVGNAAKGY
uniref:Fibronectin type-III domain-containing protein n=1 Tax=Meloidogyne javanica TaxID=6303 RepID=A0A915LDH8_MELJA